MKRFRLEEINQEDLCVVDYSNKVKVSFKNGNYIGSVEIIEIRPRDKEKEEKQKQIINDIKSWLFRYHKNKI